MLQAYNVESLHDVLRTILAVLAKHSRSGTVLGTGDRTCGLVVPTAPENTSRVARTCYDAGSVALKAFYSQATHLLACKLSDYTKTSVGITSMRSRPAVHLANAGLCFA
jgi:hypothetical protein